MIQIQKLHFADENDQMKDLGNLIDTLKKRVQPEVKSTDDVKLAVCTLKFATIRASLGARALLLTFTDERSHCGRSDARCRKQAILFGTHN